MIQQAKAGLASKKSGVGAGAGAPAPASPRTRPVAPLPAVSRKPTTPFATSQPTLSCPVCAGAMVTRTAKKGTNAGKTFWGCVSYPACRGTRPV